MLASTFTSTSSNKRSSRTWRSTFSHSPRRVELRPGRRRTLRAALRVAGSGGRGRGCPHGGCRSSAAGGRGLRAQGVLEDPVTGFKVTSLKTAKTCHLKLVRARKSRFFKGFGNVPMIFRGCGLKPKTQNEHKMLVNWKGVGSKRKINLAPTNFASGFSQNPSTWLK